MEMVEKVARAALAKIAANDDVYVRVYDDDITDVVIDGKVDLLAVAKAAIEAMREPTDAMLSAEVDGVYSLKGHLDALSAESVYRAMIDAALKEPTP